MNRFRPLTALVTVLALAFAQLAVAAHACTKFERAHAAVAYPPCHGSQSHEQPAASDMLCAQHCQHGDASFDNGQPAPAAVDNAGPLLRVELANPDGSTDAGAAWRFMPEAAPPPATILFGVMRI